MAATDVMKQAVDTLVEEALDILVGLGVPLIGLSLRRKIKMAKAFLAVANVKPGTPWPLAKDAGSPFHLQTRQIIAFMNAHLEEKIADSSYDDVRRKDLALPVEALIVRKSAKNPDANTNDGTRGFAIDPSAANAVRAFGTSRWELAVSEFMRDRETLAEQFARARSLARIPVLLSSGLSLTFSPGAHNLLQKAIIEDFLPLFGFGAEVMYVGDTANKRLYLNQEGLKALRFFELAHDKLPDVVAYSKAKNWLYLIEAVTTANPISELRRKTLLELTSSCAADVILVTAFPDRATFRRFSADIAWETEAWIADAPEHMVHLNGDKFLGPHGSKNESKLGSR